MFLKRDLGKLLGLLSLERLRGLSSSVGENPNQWRAGCKVSPPGETKGSPGGGLLSRGQCDSNLRASNLRASNLQASNLRASNLWASNLRPVRERLGRGAPWPPWLPPEPGFQGRAIAD